jgi:hypothetical protein
MATTRSIGQNWRWAIFEGFAKSADLRYLATHDTSFLDLRGSGEIGPVSAEVTITTNSYCAMDMPYEI